jgi:hypothetical protein
MARGFESKSVASQQDEKDAVRPATSAPQGDPAAIARRRRLELSRADTLRQLAVATAPLHRQLLERALVALDQELGGLP